MATTIKGSGPQLSEDDVAKLEVEIGARLPPRYRAFLLAHNGGGPDVDIGPRGRGCSIVALSCQGLPASVYGPPDAKPSIESFFEIGMTPRAPGRIADLDLRKNLAIYRGRLPSDTFPVAEDGQGNLFLVGLSDDNADHVFFWSHNDEGEAPSYENVTLVAESFETFLAALGRAGPRLMRTQDGALHFWEAYVEGPLVKERWGLARKPGETRTTEYTSNAEAHAELAKLTESKRGEGYA